MLAAGVCCALPGGPVMAEGLLKYPKGWTRVQGNTITFCSSAQDPAFDVHRDVARALARLMGLNHEFFPYHRDEQDQRPMAVRREEFVILLTDYCDVFLGTPVSTTPTFDRPADEETLSTLPYFITSFLLAVRAPKDAALSRLPPGSSIGAEFSSLPAMLLASFKKGSYPLRLYDTAGEVVEALLDGQVDAIAIWAPHLFKLLGAPQQRGVRVGPITELPGMEWAITGTVLRERTALRMAVDGAIERLLAAGQVSRILERYGFTPPFFRQPQPGFVPVDEL